MAKTEAKDCIRLSFTGDILFSPKQTQLIEKSGQRKIFGKSLEEVFLTSDYAVANLETPLSNKNKKSQSNSKFVFTASQKYAEQIQRSGVDLVSTANNHCLDNGIDGAIETLDILDKVGLEHVGTNRSQDERQNILIKNIDGVKVSFLSYTYGTNAFINHVYLPSNKQFLVNLFRKQESKTTIFRRIKWKICPNFDIFCYARDKKYLKQIGRDIDLAKSQSDLVVILMHSGGQYNKKVDHYTKKLSQFLVKSGADCVIGNHPHVMLPIKKYRGGFIAYSLGNLYALPFENENQKDDGPDYSMILNIYVDKKTKQLANFSYYLAKTSLTKDGLRCDLVSANEHILG